MNGRELTEWTKVQKSSIREQNKVGSKLKKIDKMLEDLFEMAEPIELAEIRGNFNLLLKKYDSKMKKGRLEKLDRDIQRIDDDILDLRKNRKRLAAARSNSKRKPKKKGKDDSFMDELRPEDIP